MKHKAIFLDRDGVINVDKEYPATIGDIEIYKDIKPFLDEVLDLQYIIIIVTNQSGVARGFFTYSMAIEINEHVMSVLNDDQYRITDYFMCPHHPEGIIKEYSKECECRKPKTGLIDKALKKYNISANESYLIGDKYSDYVAGTSSGIQSFILNRTGKHPDEGIVSYNNLTEILNYIKENSNE